MPAPLEVLPSLLLWAPELDSTRKVGKVTYVDALELSECSTEPSRYYVEHYQEIPGAYGQAFGPFALDQIIRFCRRLKGRLASHRCANQEPLCLTTAADCQEDHTNASVLLGAYLILVQDWTVERVTEVLGSKEANRKFPCAWAKAKLNDSSHWLMRVKFCWEGFELATKEGWIDTICLGSDDLTETFCEKYREMVRTYDASWIVPGKILISADPVTTMCDPNPVTFTELWAEGNHADCKSNDCSEETDETSTADTEHAIADTEHAMSPRASPKKLLVSQHKKRFSVDVDDPGNLDDLVKPEAPSTTTSKQESEKHSSKQESEKHFSVHDYQQVSQQCHAMAPRASPKKYFSAHDVPDKVDDRENEAPSTTTSKQDSVETICKHYERRPSLHTLNSTASTPSMAYSSFLQECGVSYVIRANFSKEQGMPRASYDAQRMKRCNIGHKDIQIVDKGGGSPQKSSMDSLLSARADMSTKCPDRAVNIHCKGGFGRSVVLGCCLAIHDYDVPGSALLGWSRIVRPGAITTTAQEEFLLNLKGRSCVLKYAGRRPASPGGPGAGNDGSNVGCGCIVQ